MMEWKWPVLFGVISSCAAVSFFKIDPGYAVWFGLKTSFKVGLIISGIYFVSLLLYKQYKAFKAQYWSEQERSGESDEGDIYEAKKQKAREEAQTKTKEQADDYKERILTPREEAKKRQKEEEFRRFMGPAWKGKGEQLGGEDVRPNCGEDLLPGAEARHIRQLPPEVKLHVPKRPETNKRKVIELPEEPGEDVLNTTMVVLRTPIGTKHKRRFLKASKLQVVFDFMTTVGFHQRVYTLSMSYPRRPLFDQSETTLHDLGFGGQMILNIEEKDL